MTVCLSSAESLKFFNRASKNNYVNPFALVLHSSVLQLSTALVRIAFFSPRYLRVSFAAPLRPLRQGFRNSINNNHTMIVQELRIKIPL